MSDRAMFYTDKDFQHRFVIFYEFDGQNDEINYLISTLQTEGRLKYETTEKVNGQFVTRCIDKEGPTGFFTTTTKPQIFDENETRIFSLFINESEEQTKKILKHIRDRKCACTWDNAIPFNIMYTPKTYPRYLKNLITMQFSRKYERIP